MEVDKVKVEVEKVKVEVDKIVKVEVDKVKANEFSTYEELKQGIGNHEIAEYRKYVITWSKAGFRDISVKDYLSGKSDTKNLKIRWELSGEYPIEYNGFPFIYMGREIYSCHQGKCRHSKANSENQRKKDNQLLTDHCYNVKSRKLIQNTKKLDCPANFVVKKIIRFKDFGIASNTRHLRDVQSKKVKASILNTTNTTTTTTTTTTTEISEIGELIYMCEFPSKSAHKYHHNGPAAGLIEPLDSNVEDYLKQEIRLGCRKTSELRRCAERYVNDTIFQGEKNPAMHRRRFRPGRKKIKNLVLAVSREIHQSKVDQENVELLKEKWAKFGDIFFTPYRKDDNDNDYDNTFADDDNSDDSSDDDFEYANVDNQLCFIYQSNEMKRLYHRYAPHLILLDATYKTTKYTLPLFFLVVKTNVNYMVVAVFIIQEETTKMITKALEEIKYWSPDIVPKYAMVDFDEREIAALESVFPGMSAFLCDFHREQAWVRWTSLTE